VRETWRTPVGRGFIMLAVMSAAFGFAWNAHSNLITNFFYDVLHLSGPQFGYITAIREVGGFVVIFLSALLCRISLQRVTAGALVVLAVGYVLFARSVDFVTLIPWVIVTSLGMHTVFQTQTSLALSLTGPAKSGAVLGRMTAYQQVGTFAALVLIFVVFQFHWLSFRPMFIILGGVAFIAAVAIVGFPHLHEGEPRKVPLERAPIVLRWDYRRYYWLSILDGARAQVFFSFGLWVLVNRFGLDVPHISLILLVVTFACMLVTPWFGRSIDRYGERAILSIVNVAYAIALIGYAFANSVYLACLFYLIYAIINPISGIGASTYLRRICAPEDLASSLAMGLTLNHVTSIVVPVAAGFVLNYVGYQVPFLAVCGTALMAVFVTRGLDAMSQRCAARIAADEAAATLPLADEVAPALPPGG
jgi:predicted MFS family arabinose efflux permease